LYFKRKLSVNSAHFTNQTHNITNIETLKAHFGHISVQDCHLQREENISFKIKFPMISCYLTGISVCRNFVVDVN